MRADDVEVERLILLLLVFEVERVVVEGVVVVTRPRVDEAAAPEDVTVPEGRVVVPTEVEGVLTDAGHLVEDDVLVDDADG